MKKITKIVGYLFIAIFFSIALSGCAMDADVVSENLSKDANMFRVNRRIVFYNGITGEYMLQIEEYCSLGNNDTERQRTVTCKVGNDKYKKHFLGLSDNVTYFAEQIESKEEDPNHYKIISKPSTIIPDIEIK